MQRVIRDSDHPARIIPCSCNLQWTRGRARRRLPSQDSGIPAPTGLRVKEQGMRTRREIVYLRFSRAIAAAVALGFGGLARAQDDANDSAAWSMFSCANPTVISQFIAAEYPEDIALLFNAVAEGVCSISAEPLQVEPVHFVGEVKANARAAEPVGYVWAVRLPDRVIAYSYFWRSKHEAMQAHTRPQSGVRRPTSSTIVEL